MTQRIIVMDTETGGLDPQKHSLLQIGLMVCEDGAVLDKIRINVTHDKYVTTPYALELNGIDLSTHEGPRPKEAVEQVINFVKKHFTNPAQVLGHNVSFDVGFLKVLFKKAEVDYDSVFSYRLLDTSSIARFLVFSGVIPSGGSLEQLANQFGIPFNPKKLHDALVDCEVTYQLILEMTKLFPKPIVES